MSAAHFTAPVPTRMRRARGLRKLVAGTTLALLASLIDVTPAAAAPSNHGDPAVISDWNAIAVTTLLADPTKVPQESFLYLGFVQAAVYNAVVGIDGRYEPYRNDARAPHRASDQAAAVAAAHKILVEYSPYAMASLDAAYAASLAAIPAGLAKTNGIAFGELAASTLINQRHGDGRNAAILFTQPPGPGVWRPTPPAALSMAVPWMGFVEPLLIHSGSQFGLTEPPPALNSPEYTVISARSRSSARLGRQHGRPSRRPPRCSSLVTRRAVQRGTAGSAHRASPRHRGRRADVCRRGHEPGRRDHLRLAREVRLRILAPHLRDPAGQHRRQPGDHGRPELDAAAYDAAVPGLRQRVFRRHGCLRRCPG